MGDDEVSHAYVIPAYGDSPYLVECIESLLAQSIPSEVILSTSTPSSYLEGIARNYDIYYSVHSPNLGIGNDWNMAMKSADFDWVTLAHQDDVYYPAYGERVINIISQYPDAALIFTDYSELRDGVSTEYNTLLWLKKLLLQFGFLGRPSISGVLSKRNCLRFACPIPCPAVTIRKRPDFLFDTELKLNLDWEAWIRLASTDGSFVWIRDVLMSHRIHNSSETSEGILTGLRQLEDLALLERFWPRFIAKVIAKTYRFAYRRAESR